MNAAQKMTFTKKFKKGVRRNERRMKETKKAKRALRLVALTIFTILALQALISTANSSKTIMIENNWGARESLENVADQSAMSTDEDGVVAETKEARVVQSNSSSEVVRMIEEKFPENPKVVTAVFKAESGHRTDAMGWNCYYNGQSKSCLPQDRGKAWSVDCGVAQINVIGKTCPKEYFDPALNLEIARKKYDSRGLTPWYAYTLGTYKKFMN